MSVFDIDLHNNIEDSVIEESFNNYDSFECKMGTLDDVSEGIHNNFNYFVKIPKSLVMAIGIKDIFSFSIQNICENQKYIPLIQKHVDFNLESALNRQHDNKIILHGVVCKKDAILQFIDDYNKYVMSILTTKSVDSPNTPVNLKLISKHKTKLIIQEFIKHTSMVQSTYYNVMQQEGIFYNCHLNCNDFIGSTDNNCVITPSSDDILTKFELNPHRLVRDYLTSEDYESFICIDNLELQYSWVDQSIF